MSGLKKVNNFHRAFSLLLGAAFTVLCLWTVFAQEKSAYTTRQWEVARIAPGYLNGTTIQEVRIDVVDTEGVCLYVARGATGTWTTAVLSAIPKTQLRPGVGCQ